MPLAKITTLKICYIVLSNRFILHTWQFKELVRHIKKGLFSIATYHPPKLNMVTFAVINDGYSTRSQNAVLKLNREFPFIREQ